VLRCDRGDVGEGMEGTAVGEEPAARVKLPVALEDAGGEGEALGLPGLDSLAPGLEVVV
jgi:hypothetical protein